VAADEAANNLGHRKVADYHILLGLMHEESCFAAQLLRRHGVLADDLLAKAPSFHENTEDPVSPRSNAAVNLTPAERRMGELENRVIELMQAHDYRGALKIVDDALADPSLGRTPAMRTSLSIAAIIARIIGDIDLAIHYYQLEVARDPDSALALYGLAWCLKEQGKADEARKAASRSYQLSLAQHGAIGEGLVELIEKQFPEIKPQA
jgi:tetratricopeptide (TPR) repeat protein